MLRAIIRMRNSGISSGTFMAYKPLMTPARMVFAIMLTAACLAPASFAQQPSDFPQQIKQQEQKLAQSRAAKDRKSETQQLIALATLYSKVG
jgi:hypothetical protein